MGLKSIPSSVNLPGGLRVVAHYFRITKLDAGDRPVAFERVAKGGHDCVLWASPAFTDEPLDSAMQAKFLARGGDPKAGR